MIFTVLAIAFVGGVLLPRRGVPVVVVASVIWAAIGLVEGSIDSAGKLLGSTALGAVNAAVGFGFGWFVRSSVGRVTRLGVTFPHFGRGG